MTAGLNETQSQFLTPAAAPNGSAILWAAALLAAAMIGAVGTAAAQDFQIPGEQVLRSLSPDEKAAMERQMTTEALAWPMTTLDEVLPQPDIMEELSPRRTGIIRGADDLHRASGGALIFDLEDERGMARLENFEAVRGPGLHVYLARHRAPQTQEDLGADFLDLGPAESQQRQPQLSVHGGLARLPFARHLQPAVRGHLRGGAPAMTPAGAITNHGKTRILAGFGAVALVILAAAGIAAAQNAERVELPKFRDVPGWFMFHVVNDPDQKILAELYAEIDIINSTEAGQPAMDGTIIVREVYQAVLDADGNPVLDDDGMFQKSRRLDLWVMEKRAGWGGDGAAGDWEFARFRPSGARIGGADNTECHECHIKAAQTDFMFNFGALEGEGWLMPE